MKKEYALLLLWGAFALVGTVLLVYYQAPTMAVLVYLLAAVLLLLWQYRWFTKPAQRRSEQLNSKNHLALLQSFADGMALDDPILEDVRELFQSYAAEIGRGHSASLLNKQAQIHALQSQINPHFLYNTLESIRGQALCEGSREIAAMAEALAAFFRYNISLKSYLVTLREELANVRNYFLIQEYRFSGRFRLAVEIGCEDAVLDCYIPKLTIQPIVENAIFHGLETKGGQGLVTIRIEMTDIRLLLTVSDDGIGMDETVLESLNQRVREVLPTANSAVKGTGITLFNVNKRIELVFGSEYGLCIYSTLGLGTDVEIVLPRLAEKEGYDSV